MERRPTHAHGTRAARIHGIAEEANAPDAASTSTSTLSTTPAGAPIPNELVEQSEQPKIEVVKTDDAIDGHDKSETGEQTTPPAPPTTALVADANCKMQQHGQPTSTSTANVDGAAATRPGSQEWLAAKQYAMINDQFGQLSAAQKEIEKLKAELQLSRPVPIFRKFFSEIWARAARGRGDVPNLCNRLLKFGSASLKDNFGEQ